jgi:hypothetical protein
MSTKKYAFTLLFALGLLTSFSAKAQSDIADIFKAGVNDLQTVANGYIKPFGNGFSSGLGNNWYNTAATHKLLGFDITVGASGIFTPSDDKTFSLSGLQKLTVVNGEKTAPTFGGKGDGVLLALRQNVNGTTQTVTQFRTPGGVSRVTPVPSFQVTLGLPMGNDLSVRFIPTINAGNFSGNMWGIGLKHNIKQWIPVLKLLPFDAAVMIGYTKFNVNYSFDNPITPSDLVSDPSKVSTPSGVSYTDQGMKLKASALMVHAIVSKKIAFITPYLGFGITRSNFDFNFTGNFPVLDNFNTTTQKFDVKTLKDPIPLHYAMTQPGATIGLRMKLLWIFAFHAQYTLQKYSTASVGFGLNIR